MYCSTSVESSTTCPGTRAASVHLNHLTHPCPNRIASGLSGVVASWSYQGNARASEPEVCRSRGCPAGLHAGAMRRYASPSRLWVGFQFRRRRNQWVNTVRNVVAMRRETREKHSAIGSGRGRRTLSTSPSTVMEDVPSGGSWGSYGTARIHCLSTNAERWALLWGRATRRQFVRSSVAANRQGSRPRFARAERRGPRSIRPLHFRRTAGSELR